MEKQESIQLLQEAAQEIKQLRRSNELKSARLDMFDSMMLLFVTRPDSRPQGMSPDLVCQIEKFIESTKKPVSKP